MTRTPRLALLALMAALLVPSLALVPRAAHVFYAGQSLVLAPLALLAFLLALSQAATPPKWPKWLSAGLLALLALWAFTVALNLRPGPITRFLKVIPAPQVFTTASLRATLALAAVGLAWAAWRSTARPGLPRALQATALGLGACWSLAGALSFRPDLAVSTLTDWYAYMLVFAAVWMLADSAQRRRRLVGLLLLGGALNVLYGLLQASGHDPMPWNERFGGRAAGFLGNPNYLGGHLALLLPLSLALALDKRSAAGLRFGRWALLLLLATGLFATQTRGAWAGALLGCGLLLLVARRVSPGLVARNAKPLLLSLSLLLLGGGIFMATHPKALNRVLDAVQGQDVETGRRGFLMRKTAQLAAEHPLLGVGPGNFRIWFPSVQVKGLSPDKLNTQAYILSEHGHNDVLQMAADAGWAAAGLWVLLLGLLFYELWHGLLRRHAVARAGEGGESLLGLGVLGALAALSVHGLANFPFLILPTQAAAWALAALALRALAPASALPDSGEELMDETSAPPPSPAPSASWRRGLLLMALLAFTLLTLVQTRRLLQDMHWWVGEGELGLNHADQASPVLLRALDYDRREDRLWKLHGRAEFDRGMVWNAVGSLREAVRLSPFDAEAAVRLGRALVENSLSGGGDVKLTNEAIDTLYKVSVYAPNFIDLWEPLAAAYFKAGRYDEAVRAYDWMIYFDVNTQAAFANKAAAQGNLGQLPNALLTLKQAEQRYPGDGKLQINLCITYLKLGMRAEAKAAWLKAKQLLPSDPQVDQLRKVLR